MNPLSVVLSFTLLIATIATASSNTQTSRTYWRVPLDSLAIGHPKHTHAAVTGVVSYYRREDDGDLHIRLTSPSGRFIIAECIPALPCARPQAGTRITVRGITRQDPEHLWWEIHPVESWSVAP